MSPQVPVGAADQQGMIASPTGVAHANTTAMAQAWLRATVPVQAPRGEATSATLSTSQRPLVDALADLVGMTSDELRQAVASGQPIESVAASYGVDLDQLGAKVTTTTGLLLDVKA